ncbi:MAG: hypothetical protein KKD05_08865 [Candidatus Omnitrophica bacterium]|nr:hypothetical protein [Candidatus Omnitrophota bacterium]
MLFLDKGFKQIIIRRIAVSFLLFILLIVISNQCFAESFLTTKVDTIEGPKLQKTEKVQQVLRNLEIPSELGFIKEIHVPKTPTEKMIINIQDLHCNYKAQKNIAGILAYLTQTYGIKLISVEGGSGKIDTTFYQQLPDEKIKEQVADYFLREARINGTEYFAITTERPIALYGAEDAKYYDKNLDAFMRALPAREIILETIAVLENDLNILKNKTYNKKLQELDDYIVSYDNGEMGFEDYIQHIAKLYSADNLKREFDQVNQLVESMNFKNSISVEKAEKQRKELIDYLTNNLVRYEMEEFLKATVEYKAKTLDNLAYHVVLQKLYNQMEKKNQTLDRKWPDLNGYIEYLKRHETLDKFALFTQIDKLLELIKNSLYTSYTQKTLDYNLKIVRLARSLFSTKLLNKDLSLVKKYQTDFNAKKMKTYISRESKRLKLELTIPDDEKLKQMEQTLPAVEDFYVYAAKRNDILALNTLEGMAKENEDIGILITGGFHTEGITDYLKDKRITYIVIVPKIDELDTDDTRYINALQGKKTPFEEMIEKEEKVAKE